MTSDIPSYRRTGVGPKIAKTTHKKSDTRFALQIKNIDSTTKKKKKEKRKKKIKKKTSTISS
jgi:hypothetical protein